jgi:hypothetical protein
MAVFKNGIFAYNNGQIVTPQSLGISLSGIQTCQQFFTSGSLTNTTQRYAIYALVGDLENYGIWSKMKAIYPMVGQAGVPSSFQLNLKDPSTFKGTFSGGWEYSTTGVTPNGVDAYMDTNFSPTGNLSQTSMALSLYIRNNPTSTGWDLNSENSTGTFFSVLIPSYNGAAGFFGNNTSLTSATNTDALGFTLNTRISNSGYKVFKNNISILNTNTVTSGQTTTNFILGARTTSLSFANKNYAFCHIGDGLTDTEATNLYTAVQRFQTTLGRQV